jgi:ethanolamine utilization protein EutN
MKACRVVGPMWASVKHPAYAGKTMFIVQPIDERGADTGASFIAVDTVQAGIGDKVIVLTEGNGVRQILKAGDKTPIRSIIVGIVDAMETT